MSADFPHHPDSHVIRWSDLEIACITQYANAVRNAALERAAKICEGVNSHAAHDCADEIRAMKVKA